MTINPNNANSSNTFGQTEGVRAYHTLVREIPGLKDRCVEDVGGYALNKAMMNAGKTAQDVDRRIALGAILKTVDEQTLSGAEGNEAG